MKIKALIAFAGVVCMAPGDVREVSDATAKDLISCGYAVCVDEKKLVVKQASVNTDVHKKSSKKAVVSDESK